MGTVTTCHPLAASRAPSDHTVHLALLGAFTVGFFSKLQEEFPAISCSPALMIPHFQREEPEQGTHPPAFLWNCCSHQVSHVGGTSKLPAGKPPGSLQEGSWNNQSLPFSGAFQQRISKRTDPEANQAEREQLAGQRRDGNGLGGMGRSRTGGMRSGLTHHGAVGRRFWISALPWH